MSSTRYREIAVEINLSLEQSLSLRKLALELEEMSRQELIEAVLEEREQRLLQERFFLASMAAEGIPAEVDDAFELALPETEEDMIAVFGHVPDDEELSDYVNRQIEAHMEAARMDVDIEAIALGLDA